jgi:hypothetical protein
MNTYIATADHHSTTIQCYTLEFAQALANDWATLHGYSTPRIQCQHIPPRPIAATMRWLCYTIKEYWLML